ncbi:hypothetical protein [Streptomyces flaveolus]|uniref:hypothetical protein n=1 Tax=Streptomyces flaveolus TaxID=67297 RepID=UPI003402921E
MDGAPVESADPAAAKEPSETSETSDGAGDSPAPSPAPTPAPALASTPHDETIQLDDVRLGAVGAEPAVRDPRGSDGPVFVDESGRRSRRFRRLGVAVAVACAGYAAVIVATLLSGNSAAPWLPVPGQHEDKPAGKVDTSPLPSVSTTPNPPGAGTVTAPVVGAEAGGTAVPGSGAPADADASASTGPDGGAASAPATDAGTTASPTPSAPATAVSPAPSATGTATAPAPTPTPSGRTHTPPGHTRRPHPKLSL